MRTSHGVVRGTGLLARPLTLARTRLSRSERIANCFVKLRRERRKALLTFITAGDPDLRTTGKLVLALEKAGADIIELGVPFSDPMADGPVIQAASERALAGGASLKKIIHLVARLRTQTAIPILLMGYYNPIFVMGLKRFAVQAKRGGVDGVLVVDLPPEAARPLSRELKKVGLSLIHLLAPTSDADRIRKVVRSASGFIYYVSVTGITGGRSGLMAEMKLQVARVRRASRLPVVIGFGITQPQQAKNIARLADGVVVGSAVVARIAKAGSRGQKIKSAARFVAGLRRVL